MKIKKEIASTTNRRVFNRLYKRLLDHQGKIRCDRCPYHKNENGVSKSRNWKRFRKTQYYERKNGMDLHEKMLQEKINNLGEFIEKLERDNEELGEVTEQQGREIEELQKRNSELEDENQTLAEKLATLEVCIDDIGSSINSIGKSLSSARKVL